MAAMTFETGLGTLERIEEDALNQGMTVFAWITSQLRQAAEISCLLFAEAEAEAVADEPPKDPPFSMETLRELL